jgi:hypothetical protein
MVILVGETLEIVERGVDDFEVGISSCPEDPYLPIKAADHLGDTPVLLSQFIQELGHGHLLQRQRVVSDVLMSSSNTL